MNKLTIKLVTFILTFATMFVVAIPVFAAEIDYLEEQITGLNNTQEYSWDRTKWFDIYDASNSKIDITPMIKASGSVNFYYRTKDIVDPETTIIAIPARPVAPKAIKFTPKATPALDVINTTNLHEVKYQHSTWVQSPEEGTLVSIFEKKGADLLVRNKAIENVSFASAEAKVNVPKQRTSPTTAKYDVTTDGVVVGKGMEYQIGTRPLTGTGTSIVDDAWKTVASSQTIVSRKEIDTALSSLSGKEGDAACVYVRLKNSATAAASLHSSVKVPASIDAPTTPTISMTDEKIKNASSLMEYRVLNDKTALTASYSLPKWTSIGSSEASITKLISASNSKAPNTIVQVRLKSVSGSGTVLDKPASAAKEFKIAKRPATPKTTDLTLNYDPNVLTLAVPATHQWMYDGSAKWTDGGGDVDMRAKVPDRGDKATKVLVRVMAIEAASGSDVATPASLAFTGGKINPTPAAPKTPIYSVKTKKITGVTKTMEYVIGSGSNWETVSGTVIDLSTESPGTTGIVKVRLKSTATKPVSEEKLVEFLIPDKK